MISEMGPAVDAYVTSVAEIRQVILELSLSHSYLEETINTKIARVTLVKSELSTLKVMVFYTRYGLPYTA